MASLRSRSDNGLLFFDFRWNGRRYRSATDLLDNEVNRAALLPKLKALQASIRSGLFSPETFFPEFRNEGGVLKTVQIPEPPSDRQSQVHYFAPQPQAVWAPDFDAFATTWFADFSVGWRRTYQTTVDGIIAKHLKPRFGSMPVSAITRAQILEFRAHLTNLRGRQPNTKLSAIRVNTIMLILRQILQEAADRYEFTMPMGKIKALKLKRVDVKPFSLEEVRRLCDTVREDYRAYLRVRFFTGMRSGEIHGLKWKYVDFDRRLILIRETLIDGEDEYTKTDASQREIVMSDIVLQALREQHKRTGKHAYVFVNQKGDPLDTANFTKRIWYPLLRYLRLEARRPYQTRHTCASLWLAAGETPEWCARQLGHSSTEMLFKVYSRFVPNMTRNDGSAMERLLNAAFTNPATKPGASADKAAAPRGNTS